MPCVTSQRQFTRSGQEKVCGPRRFNHLRELIPNKEKLDKAAFLMSTMDYIKQLQVGVPRGTAVCDHESGTHNPAHVQAPAQTLMQTPSKTTQTGGPAAARRLCTEVFCI